MRYIQLATGRMLVHLERASLPDPSGLPQRVQRQTQDETWSRVSKDEVESEGGKRVALMTLAVAARDVASRVPAARAGVISALSPAHRIFLPSAPSTYISSRESL